MFYGIYLLSPPEDSDEEDIDEANKQISFRNEHGVEIVPPPDATGSPELLLASQSSVGDVVGPLPSPHDGILDSNPGMSKRFGFGAMSSGAANTNTRHLNAMKARTLMQRTKAMMAAAADAMDEDDEGEALR